MSKHEKLDFQKLPDAICVGNGEKNGISCTLSVLAKKLLPQNSQTQEKI